MCGWRPLQLPLAIAALAAGGGCETIKQDMAAFGESITPVSPQQAARWMMDPHDPDNRRKGTVAISNSPFGGAEAYVAVYRDRAVHESDPLVRAVSLTALGRHGEALDARLVAANLADEHFQVRWAAARALQRLHDPAVVPELLATLRKHDEETDIRVAAAVALGQYPQDRVFQGLVGALDAPQLAVNVAARDSLHTLTGQALGLDPAAWLDWYDGAANAFADGGEYLYPTYSREHTWLEKLSFWSSKHYEQPAPPAGIEPEARRTYPDTEPAGDGTGG